MNENVKVAETYARDSNQGAFLELDLSRLSSRLCLQVYAYGLIAEGYESEGARILKALSIIERN